MWNYCQLKKHLEIKSGKFTGVSWIIDCVFFFSYRSNFKSTICNKTEANRSKPRLNLSGPERRWGETCRIAPSPCCGPASLFPLSHSAETAKICPLTRLTEFFEHGQLWQPPVRCCLLAATSYMCYSCSLVQEFPERGPGPAGVTEREEAEEEGESWWSASSAASDVLSAL